MTLKILKRNIETKAVAFALMTVGLLCGAVFSASAYVDPSATTILAQSIASIAAILASALVLLWRRVRKKVFKFLGIKTDRSKQVEPEVEVFAACEDSPYDEAQKKKWDDVALAEKAKQEKKQGLKMPYRKRLLFSAISSLFLSLTVMFFAPTEVYLGNFNDFYFPLAILAKAALPGAIVLGAVLSLLVAIVPGKAWYFVSSTVFGLGLCCYLQSVLLNGKMGTLADTSDPYSAATVTLNLIVWAVILAAVILLTVFAVRKNDSQKYKTVLCSLAALLVFMQTVGVLSATSQTAKERATLSYSTVSDEGVNTLAKQNNVVVFILDTACDAYVRMTLEEDPDLFSDMDGFIYYNDATSRYSRTYPSIPYLLSHEDCSFDAPVGSYLETAYQNSTYLSGMKENGCNVGVYTENAMLSKSIMQYLDNREEDSANKGNLKLESLFNFYLCVGQISLYREAPYVFKDSLRYDPEKINGDVMNGHSYFDFEGTFYQTIQEEGITVTEDDSAFRFFHFFGPHPYARLRADGTLGLTETDSVTDVVRGDFTIIKAYLNELKEHGIYDETTVIITADHGISKLAEGKDLDIKAEIAILMMVKPQYSTGACRTSTAPVCQEDLFATVYRGLGIEDSPYQTGIEDIPEDAERTRMYYYSALFSDGDGEIAKMEVAVNGPAYKRSSYSFTGNVWDINYSTRGVSKTRFSWDLVKD